MEEIQAKAIYTSLVGNIARVTDDTWDFVKTYNWLNEADSSEEVLSISLTVFRETPIDNIDKEHWDLYEKLKHTFDMYFADPEIKEVRFHRNW